MDVKKSFFKCITGTLAGVMILSGSSADLLYENSCKNISDTKSCISVSAATSNEQKIFNFLRDEMHLNTAAICGILANIEKESGFRSDIKEYGYTWETGCGYGICQWTNTPRTSSTGRRTNLVNFCNKNGYDYKSLEGQLWFLKYESIQI